MAMRESLQGERRRRWPWTHGAAWATALISSLTLFALACGGEGGNLSAEASTRPTTLPLQGPAPDFMLTNHDGQRVRLSDLRGHVVLMSFFYATCPDFCPLMSANIKQVYDALDHETRDRVALLSITFDPLTDSPAALKAYARKHGFDVPGWHFLTGTPEEVGRVTGAYGIAVQPTGPQVHIHLDGTHHLHQRDFGHMAQALLIDQAGQVRRAYLGAPQEDEIFSPQLIAGDIASLLEVGPPGTAPLTGP